MLRDDFHAWRHEQAEIEDRFLKGVITVEEYYAALLANCQNAGRNMFAMVHQHCDW